MNGRIGAIVTVFCLLTGWVGQAEPVWAQSTVGDQLSDLLDRLPESNARISAKVIDASDGRVIYERNADQGLIPASTQKALVMAVALEQLGGEFEFVTRFGMIGPHLVVIGAGDPGLGDPRLAEAAGEEITTVFDRLADALLKRGVTRIDGDLVLDESIFDRQGVHPSWEPSDLPRWYAAPVGALNLNDNCLDFTVWPGTSSGDGPGWSVNPPNEFARVINDMRTANHGTPVIHRPGDEFAFQLSGKCSRRGALQPVSVPDPGLLFGSALCTHLKFRGIDIAGDLVRTSKQVDRSQFETILEHRTGLANVLRRIGWNSQNMFAECLLKRLGYEWSRSAGRSDPVGSWESGRSAIMDGLRRLGISGESLSMADGSGLSRDNRVSAGEMVAVMQRMLEHNERSLFLASLSGSHGEGRLARRMSTVNGTVYAKTGTIRGVRAIVGVIESGTGEWYCFSFIFNNIKRKSKPFNDLIDRACEILGT
jgi:D-alanyl-D-alanine carboxypeptidase/D-alanyl-D-alanine-endopeptidase (penicillin-binding protein 4)